MRPPLRRLEDTCAQVWPQVLLVINFLFWGWGLSCLWAWLVSKRRKEAVAKILPEQGSLVDKQKVQVGGSGYVVL